MNDLDTILANIHSAMLRSAKHAQEGDMELSQAAYDEATEILQHALNEAHVEGREAERADQDEQAEDYEPDVSDEGFDPYLNTYTDDC